MLLDCLNVDVTVTRALLQHVVGLRKKYIYIFKTDAIDQNNPYNKIYQCQRSFHFFRKYTRLQNVWIYFKNSNRVQPKRYCTDWNEQAEQNKKTQQYYIIGMYLFSC